MNKQMRKGEGFCITGSRGRLLVWMMVLAFFLCPFSCKKNSDSGDEDPAERAKKEIIKLLVLPPDSKLRSSEVKQDLDTLILSYGTNNALEELVEFFKSGVQERGYRLVMSSESGISYMIGEKRQVTVMWYARDPDLSEFNTVFHVAVVPLPPELKPAQDKGD